MNHSKNNGGVSIAMLRAYISLSQTLNLSKTSEDMGTTRQTVRRHISDLELIMGQPLFEVADRQYRLTEKGRNALDEAKELILRFDTWAGQSLLKKDSSGGLEKLQYTDEEGRVFHSQQHPVSEIAIKGLPIMRQAFVCWGNAQSRIEHESMEKIRPYSVLYRKGPSGWVFVDVGKESAYARWFGWAWSRSAIGKLIHDDNVGDEYNEFVSGAYSGIYNEGGVRLDHISAHLPKDGGAVEAGTFQRLLLGGVFPDGTPGLILVAVITNDIQIDDLSDTDKPTMPPHLLMDNVAGLEF